jgi:hypothetical protein
MLGEGEPSTTFLRASEAVDARIREHDGEEKVRREATEKSVRGKTSAKGRKCGSTGGAG